MRRLLLIAVILLSAGAAWAQPPGISWSGASSGSGSADPSQFSSPAGTLTIGGAVGAVTLDCDGSVCVFYSTGTSDPATCTQGGMFHYRTDSSLLKFCSATDTWSQIVTVGNTSTSGFGFVVDEDDFASNSATKVPTQQSTKAYVDTAVAGAGSVNRFTTVALYEEFIGGNITAGGIGDNGLTFAAISTGTISQASNAVPGGNHPGIIRLNSHATNDNSGAILGFGNNNTSIAFREWETTDWAVDFLVLPGSNSTAITNIAEWVGLHGAYTIESSESSGIWARYDTDKTDATWIFVVCNLSGAGGCSSTGDGANAKVAASSITPVAGTWNRIRIRQAMSGVGGNRTIYFRVNDETEVTFCSSGCTDTLSTVPTGVALAPAVSYVTRTTTGVLSGDVDYMSASMPISAARY